MTLLPGHDQIETERLLLRRITPDDLPFYARIHADPDVARYLSHGRPRLLEESRAWMDSLIDSYQAFFLGQLAVTLKSDETLLGRCGLSFLETEPMPATNGTRLGYYFPARAPADLNPIVESELGYTLDPSAWGKGYASEAVRAVFDYASRHRPGDRVVSLIHPENTRSLRLAAQFGVTLVDRVTLWDRQFDRYVWPAVNSPSTDR